MAYSNTPTQSTYQQKRVSFYRDTDIRSFGTTKDRRYINVFIESEITPNTQEKTYYLKKRGGIRKLATPTVPGTPRGSLSHEGSIYFVIGDYFYRYIDGVIFSLFHFPIPRLSPVGMTVWTDSDENDYIILGDGITLWQYNLATEFVTEVPTGYPTPFLPAVFAIDGYLAIVKTGTSDIYTSQVQDVSGTWDFISAELYPDTIVAFSRYNNYLVAFGQQSLELFYDAAIEAGSPLARNDSTVITVGCAAPYTPVQSEKQLFWVGNSQEGELGVWMLEDFKVSEISSVDIRQILSSQGNSIVDAKAYVIRHYGHRFYVLLLQGSTWLFDLHEKVWLQFSYGNDDGEWPFYYNGDDSKGTCYLIGFEGVYDLDPGNYQDEDGLTIRCTWTTDPLDFGTLNRKVGHRLGLVGNIGGANSVFQVQWTDDDYQTWQPIRDLSMNLERPAIVNIGMFRRRAFKFQFFQNLPMRIEGLELYYNLMSN